MINVGISSYYDNVTGIPAESVHFRSGHRQKGSGTVIPAIMGVTADIPAVIQLKILKIII